MRSEILMIRQLRRKIRHLTRENEQLRRQYGASASQDSKNELLSLHCRDSRTVMSCTGYPQYVYSTLRRSSLYRVWMRMVTYFRRFRLISVILRIGTNLVALIETSALLIFTATVFIIALPALLVLAASASIAALIQGARLNRRLSNRLEGKRVYVFFPPSPSEPRQNSVLHATLADLASHEQNAVFMVSPYYFSSDTLGDNSPFFLLKQIPEGVCCIRKYYFFLLRRGVLSGIEERVRYIF